MLIATINDLFFIFLFSQGMLILFPFTDKPLFIVLRLLNPDSSIDIILLISILPILNLKLFLLIINCSRKSIDLTIRLSRFFSC